eukprot:TCONS_00033775-protein
MVRPIAFLLIMGHNFESTLYFEKLLKKFNVEHSKVTPYHSMAYGEVERFNRNLKKTIQASIAEGETCGKHWTIFFYFTAQQLVPQLEKPWLSLCLGEQSVTKSQQQENHLRLKTQSFNATRTRRALPRIVTISNTKPNHMISKLEIKL